MDTKKIIDKATVIKKSQERGARVVQHLTKTPPSNAEKILNVVKPVQIVSEKAKENLDKVAKNITQSSPNPLKTVGDSSSSWLIKGFGTIGAIFVAVQLAKSAYNFINALPTIHYYRYSATGPSLQRKFKEVFPIPQPISSLPPGPETIPSADCLICTTKAPEIVYLTCRHKVCCVEDTIGWFYIKFLRIIESGIFDQCELTTEFIQENLFYPSPTAVTCPVCRTPIEQLFV